MNPFEQLIALSGRAAPVLEQGGTKTERVLRYLEANPHATTAQISENVGLDHRKIWGLLKSHIEREQVIFTNGHWSTNSEYLGADVERAVSLLRAKGWDVCTSTLRARK